MTGSGSGAAGGPSVVALGGGHGLAVTLAALVGLTDRVTAVVGMGDDGGSSGRLRRELGALPPGDLRMALAALASDREVADLFQHRFDAGDLAGHPVGNLVLTGLAATTGGIVPALDVAARMLGARGRVLPVTEQQAELCATVRYPGERGEVMLRGQKAIATAGARVVRMWVEPDDLPACGAAVQAVLDADLVVLGPGSLFTSVLPHLLVSGMRRALAETTAHRVLTLNLTAQAGETTGFSAVQHLDVLLAHAPELRLEAVLADPALLEDAAELGTVAADLSGRLVLAPVAEMSQGRATGRHDLAGLRAAYADLLDGSVAPRERAGPPPSAARPTAPTRSQEDAWR